MSGHNAASRVAIVRRADEQRRLVARAGIVEVRLIVTAADTDGRCFVAEYVAQPQAPGPALHLHRETEETFYVLEGEMQFVVGDERLTADAGTVVHVPRNLPHAFWNKGPQACRMHITMAPGGFERYFEELFALSNEQAVTGTDIRLLMAKLNERYDQVVLGPNPFAAPGAK